MTGSETKWRQLREVVGSVLKDIEPKPASTGTVTRPGQTATSR